MATKIIAEIAQGYEGDPTLARLLAKAGVESGADVVKFQCVFADDTAVPSYRYYGLFKKLEMPFEVWKSIFNTVKDADKEFYLNIGGKQSLEIAQKLGVDGVRLHATNFFNTELIKAAIESFPMVYFGLGGISFVEIQDLIERYNIKPGENVSFIYGFQAEPTPIENNNILRLKTLMESFPGFDFGFEDHTDGSDRNAKIVPLMALPLGVCYIEKHLTLDRLLGLEDSISALTPQEFIDFVYNVRIMESAIGKNTSELTENEKSYRNKVLKVVVTNTDMFKDQLITKESLSLRRVENVREPAFHRKEDVVGMTLKVDLNKYEQITKEMVA
jgi:N,N'-diacetyllegionaminate synthase